MSNFSEFLRRHRKVAAMGTAVGFVLVSLGAFGLAPMLQPVATKGNTPIQLAQAQRPTTPAPRLLENGTPFSFADLVERVGPAVVTITVETQTAANDPAVDLSGIPPQLRDQFGLGQGQQGQQRQPRRGVAAGSGFIIDKAGYLVTNNHVIANARKITVKLADGRSFDAKLIGTDATTDIALVKIDSDKALPSVEFGDDHQLRVGDWVVAVGYPFGLSNTVTAGIVSAIGRDNLDNSGSDFIQIDAAINPGNSGGPTFNLRGQVVGMNSMIFSPTGGSVGIGFAIPANTIHDIVAQLKDKGKVARGWLGIEMQSITPELASSMGVKDAKGVIVANVVAGAPAEKAGFQQGDIILAINGKTVEDARDMGRTVAALLPGKSVNFTVNRQGSVKTLTALIALRADAQQVASAAPSAPAPSVDQNTQLLGLGLSAITPRIRQSLDLDESVKGVVITRVDPNSDLADKFDAGDVLLRVDNRPVQTPQDVQRLVAEVQKTGRKTISVLVNKQGNTGYIVIDLGKA